MPLAQNRFRDQTASHKPSDDPTPKPLGLATDPPKTSDDPTPKPLGLATDPSKTSDDPTPKPLGLATDPSKTSDDPTPKPLGLATDPSKTSDDPTPKPLGLATDPSKTLADILAQQGAITAEIAKSINMQEIQSGKPQEKIITEQELTDSLSLTKAKAVLYNVPFIDISKTPSSPEALAVLPQGVAEKFQVFPVRLNKKDKELVLAMADPLNITAIEFVEQKTGFIVKPFAADAEKIETLITTSYTTTLAKEVTEALKEVSDEKILTASQDTQRTGVIRKERVAEIINHILTFASKARASDVHIEPQERLTRIRYRIDGILQEKLTTPRQLHEAIVSRIKILSKMKIDEKRIPQDGRFNFKIEKEEIDLRVSSLPTAWGEKIVMRLLKKTGGIPELTELGLRGRALRNLHDTILRPHGIILLCGPTGSGKTTTLYSIIQKINTPQVNIVTLEDPIEYKISGVNQVQVNPAAGLTFASGLKSFLRQDPNIILVGEIRDQETADLAIQASLTGHLVFSTLHTNDASGALPRLLDMGAEPYLLASSVTAIVAQRVVRKIHDDCKEQYDPEPKVIEELKKVLGPLSSLQSDQKPKLYRGTGDAECGGSGYYGRVGIFEVLPVSEKIGRLILERSASTDIESTAIKEGMITLKQDGFMKVQEGITTMEEVLRVAED